MFVNRTHNSYSYNYKFNNPFFYHATLLHLALVEVSCPCGAQIARGGKTKGGRLEELGFESVPPELDLVETNDQITHQVSLEESDTYNAQIALDLFKPDDNYQEEEKKYEVGVPSDFSACN